MKRYASAALLAVVGMSLSGCQTARDALEPQADRAAREQLATVHLQTLACIREAVHQGQDVSGEALPPAVETCFEASLAELSDEDLSADSPFVPTAATTLLAVYLDAHGSGERYLQAIDVSRVTFSESLTSVSASYAQCWSLTIDFDAFDMTEPAREDCGDAVMALLPLYSEESAELLTVAPDEDN